MLRLNVGGASPSGHERAGALVPVRMTSKIPTPPVGSDMAAYGVCDDGGIYYCKDDAGHRPVRATEFLFTTLADHLNIPTAPFRAVDVEGHILFGSHQHPSTEEAVVVRRFYSNPDRNEFGGPSSWKASYFASLFVYDIFVGNFDRAGHNLVALRDGGALRVLAIDFASSTLLMRPGLDIMDGTSQTRVFAKLMRGLHGAHDDAALEMVARLESVPLSFIETVLDRMPIGWLDAGVGSRFLEFWGGDGRSGRLAVLRAGLRDGSLY